MYDGTRHVALAPTRWLALGSLSHTKEDSYVADRSIMLEGAAKRNALNASLLLDGQRSIVGLAFRLHVRVGAPFGDLGDCQSKVLPVDHRTSLPAIGKCIGTCSYAPGVFIHEMGENLPELFEARVSVDEGMFSDLWQWLQVPGLQFELLGINVFGDKLVEVEGHVQSGCYWDTKPGTGQIYVSRFYYAAAVGATRAAPLGQ